MYSLIKAISIPLQVPLRFVNNFIKPLVTTRLSPRWPTYNIIQGSRSLYTAESLGLEAFQKNGARLRTDNISHKEFFLQKMQGIADASDDSKTIQTDDLSLLIAFCQEEREHLDLIITLTRKYYKTIADISFAPFKFGPVLMRLLYDLDLPDKVLELLLDEELEKHVMGYSSYMIGMDLLYESNCYEDVDKLMKKMDESLPRDCVAVTLAAKYKISTDEALTDALDLVRRYYEIGKQPTMRMIAFTAGLALDMGKPEIALEVCTHSKDNNNYFIKNIRSLSRLRLGDMQEVLQILKLNTLVDSRYQIDERHPFASEVIQEIEEKMNEADLELTSDFAYVKKELENLDLIRSSQTLEEAICAPIRILPRSSRMQTFGRTDQSRSSFSDNRRGGFERNDFFRPRFSDERENRFEKSRFSDQRENRFERPRFSDQRDNRFEKSRFSDERENKFQRSRFSDEPENRFERSGFSGQRQKDTRRNSSRKHDEDSDDDDYRHHDR